MDNRKALLALIKQNSDKINGIVASNSEKGKVVENEKTVNSAINFSICIDSDCYYVKNFRYKVDDLSLLRLYVLQNDILAKMFTIKQLDFKFFLKDCKTLVQDYKDNERYKDYFPNSPFEYKRLVNERKEFLFTARGREPIKPLTKAESDRITYKQKYDALKETTKKAYDIYLKNVDNKEINFVSYETFENNINYGDMNKLMKGKDNMEYEDTYLPDDAKQTIQDEKDIEEISNETKSIDEIEVFERDNDQYLLPF